MIKHALLTALLATTLGCASPQQASPRPHAPSPSHASSILNTPRAITIEHEHLHDDLTAAINAGGETGRRAQEVAEILRPHFESEEAYAMPPLSLLPRLANREPISDAEAREAIRMAEQLRSHYDEMIDEHRQLTAALARLSAAAASEGHPEHAAFAESLTLHAQNEEEILYPATLVIGEYLKLLRQQ